MISIATITQNTSGNIDFDELPKTTLYDASARVTRTATLDGGSSIVHSGFSDSDRTFSIYAIVTEVQAKILKSIHETETLINLSCVEGYFSGMIKKLKVDDTEMYIQFLIKEKLSE